MQQPDIYDRLDQAVLLRQEQLLKAQSASHDSSSRYLLFLFLLLQIWEGEWVTFGLNPSLWCHHTTPFPLQLWLYRQGICYFGRIFNV